MYLHFTINPFHKKLIEFKALELPLNDELVNIIRLGIIDLHRIILNIINTMVNDFIIISI